jgi:hypothetical protein
MKAKRVSALLAPSALLIGALLLWPSCENPVAALQKPGAFTVAGFTKTIEQTRQSIEGEIECSPEHLYNAGTDSAFSERATQVLTSSYAVVPVKNSGAGDLVITGAELYLIDSNDEAVPTRQTVFAFAGSKPDFPMSVPAGATVGFTVSFNPTVAGLQKANILFKTSVGDRMVRLNGRGAWILTLSVNSDPAGMRGAIVKPILVAGGQTLTYLSEKSDLTLMAETRDPVGLTELNNWTTSTPTTIQLATPNLLMTTVTMSGSAAVQANFIQPYVFVSTSGSDAPAADRGQISNPYATLNAAIGGYVTGTHKGIAITSGAFTLSAQANLPVGLIRGGYNAAFNARPDTFKPNLATGAGGATSTALVTGASHLVMDGSDKNPATLIEGFTIMAGAVNYSQPETSDGLAVALAVLNGAAPTLRYCAFTGGIDQVSPLSNANTVGAYVYRASPVFESCVIQGGTTAATGGRSVGLWCEISSSPKLTDCLVRGGTASGTRGDSYGLLNVNFGASPLFENCSIDGGTGTENSYAIWSSYGGQPKFKGNQIFTQNAAAANYGLYLGSNGRTYVFSGNNIYNCGTGLAYFDYSGTTYTDIADVNDQWVSGWDDSYGYVDNTSVAP